MWDVIIVIKSLYWIIGMYVKFWVFSLTNLFVFFKILFWDSNIITSSPSFPFPRLYIPPYSLFKFRASFLLTDITWIICIDIWVFNIACLVSIMLLICMFSRMTIWYWKPLAVFFPGEDYFPDSQHCFFISHIFLLFFLVWNKFLIRC